ncbi:MAG: glycosyltransferase, partial [Patescibacteria group bacterium]
MTKKKKQHIGRVLMISEHADPVARPGSKEVGGQNVYVRDLARELGRQGWKVDVFTRWDNRTKKQVIKFAKNCRVIRIRSGPRQYIPRDHLFEYLPEFVDNIVAFKTESKLTYKIIHAHYWMSGWSALKLGQLWNIPVITTYHSLGYVRYHTLKLHKEQSLNSEFFKFRVRWEKELGKQGTILSTSPFEKKDLVKYYATDPVQIEVVPAGINLAMFYPIRLHLARKKIEIPLDAHLVLYVGRLEWRKGIGTLLYAIPKMLDDSPELKKTLKVVIVGRYSSGFERDEYKRLRAIARHLGIERYIIFVGSKDRSEVKYYYSAANVCVVPSYYEPFGLVPLEAFACGCPVVASKVGGLQFTVQDKYLGRLVRPRDPDALSNAIREVLDSNDKYRHDVRRYS